MAAIGLGDLRNLLAEYFATIGAVSISEPVTANTPFANFTAAVSGVCSIMVAVDTPGVHLALADLSLDQVFRGVDGGRYLFIQDWMLLQFVAITGHDYAFQVTKDCTIALQVTYSPLMS